MHRPGPRCHRNGRWWRIGFLVLPVLALHALVLQAGPTPTVRTTAPGTITAVAVPVSVPVVTSSTRTMARAGRPSPEPPARAGHATSAPPEFPVVSDLDERPPASPFVPSALLDRGPVPRSAPDPRWLDDLANQPLSGLPLRLRLFITSDGQVVEVEPVLVNELDTAALPALQAMFRHTAFVPGRLDGQDVASQMELEIRLDGQ